MNLTNAVNIISPFTASQEGFSPTPYPDAGSYAIGYGNHYYEDGTPVTADDDAIDQATALQLLNFYLNQTAQAIAPMLAVSVSDNMLAALTDLGYNWGAGNVEQSKVLALINQGADQSTVTAQWNTTAITSQGQPDSDLAKRRALESQLAYSGENTLGIVVLGLVAFFIGFFIYGAVTSKR